MQAALKDVEATTYCLKLDIKKFYPNVNHDILKQQLRRKIKDKALLWLLDEIIDSSPGLPIGNLLSQYFGNFYLSPFDHWIKENKREARYFRYMDDMIILHHSKEHLHALLAEIRQYLAVNLKLTVKQNYQVFPVAKRGIDFVGYRIFHTHTLLRKSIKQNFARKLANNPNEKVIAAYYGWVKHCNGRHLFKTLLQKHNMKKFSELGITLNTKALLGKKVPIEDVLHEQLIIESYRIEKSIYPETGNGLCLYLQVVHNGKQRVVFTGSVYLQNLMNQTKADDLPFEATIVPVGKGYAFK